MEGNLLAPSSGQFVYLWFSLGEEIILVQELSLDSPFYNPLGTVPRERKEGKQTYWSGPKPDI